MIPLNVKVDMKLSELQIGYSHCIPFPKNSCSKGFNHRHLNCMAQKIKVCGDLVSEYEKQKKINFQIFVRLRPDMFWLKKINLFDLYNENRIISWDDQMHVMSRNISKIWSINVMESYNKCANISSWSKACNISTKYASIKINRGKAPCCPIRLAAVNLNIKILECGFVYLDSVTGNCGKFIISCILFSQHKQIFILENFIIF